MGEVEGVGQLPKDDAGGNEGLGRVGAAADVDERREQQDDREEAEAVGLHEASGGLQDQDEDGDDGCGSKGPQRAREV